jgi:hypothetical protein
MEIRHFFVESWRGKVISLLIAFSIWWVIKSHLDADRQAFPVPGTSSPTPRSTSAPIIEDSILNPLSPPVPGNSEIR